MSTDAYIEQVYRNLKGELNPEEFQAFNALTAENDELASLRVEIEDTWDISGSETSIVSKEETENLFKKITSTKAKVTSIFTLKNMIAGIAAIFVLGLSSLWLIRDQAEVYDGAGTIRLSDNSIVEMREGSRLEVTSFNKQERKVSLEGEAYFDIEKDANRPFAISINNTEIEVLGTAFLVKASKSSVYVDVEEGRVRFSNDLTYQSVDLTSGMKAESDENGEIHEVQFQNLLGWKSGVFEYQEQKMSDVIDELSVIFNSSIALEKPELLNCYISAILTADNLEDILNQLAGQLEMNAKKKGQAWILSDGKCN